jgi:hypothetical protein
MTVAYRDRISRPGDLAGEIGKKYPADVIADRIMNADMTTEQRDRVVERLVRENPFLSRQLGLYVS